MCSGMGDSPRRLPGSPIRTPPDHSSVDSPPGPIAASHVLHRFLVPRHPPCALKNLATDARVHCAVLKQRPTTHLPKHGVGTEQHNLPAVPSGPNSAPHTTAPTQARSTRKSAVLGAQADPMVR